MRSLLRRRRKSWLGDERGSVAVEFSFVGPIIILLALGVTEWGRYMYVYNTLQFGCEQAARWGAFHITGTEAAVEDYAKDQMSGLDPDTVTADIDASENTVEVTAETEFEFLTGLVTDFPSITISARAKM